MYIQAYMQLQTYMPRLIAVLHAKYVAYTDTHIGKDMEHMLNAVLRISSIDFIKISCLI